MKVYCTDMCTYVCVKVKTNVRILNYTIDLAVSVVVRLYILALSVSVWVLYTFHPAALSVLFGLGVAYLHANRTICKQVSRGVSGECARY